MSDLSEQIRSYYDATTTPLDVDDVRHDRRAPVINLFDTDEWSIQEHPPADRDRPRFRRHVVIALAAACVAVALAASVIISNGRSDVDLVPADAPDPTPPLVEDEVVDGDPADLPSASDTAVPGRYTTSVLGVDATFDVPLDMIVLTARAGDVTLAHGLNGEPLSFPPSTEDWTPENIVQVSFQRIAGWSTREEATDPASDAASIDPDDVDAWVADNDVSLTSDRSVGIAGRAARVIDVEVHADATTRALTCPDRYQPCFHAVAISSSQDAARSRATTVSAAVSHRIHIVTIDGSEPLTITVTAPTGSGWFDLVQTSIIDTLELGPDAPPIGTS